MNPLIKLALTASILTIPDFIKMFQLQSDKAVEVVQN